jgi:DMSO/TMAO reductase YedYZ molybdopterin-dependent catalytic subunit
LYWLSYRERQDAAQDGRVDLPRDRDGVMQAAKRVPGTLAPLITPNQDFYVVSKNALEDPDLPPEVWELKIDGLVDTPLSLTYQDLIAMPAVEQFQTLQCISNPVGGDLMSTARWKGVPLNLLLVKAGAQAWAPKILATSDDRYSTDIPYAVAMQPDTLLAYAMNGAPLPMEHGGPVRLLIPGRYGMKNAKWVTGISVVQGDDLGFWEVNGWSDSAIAKTTSRIDTPALGATVGPGPVWIAGVAYGGRRGISTVEFSADGGDTWQAARLVEQPPSPLTWVRWEGEFTPDGSARTALVCRAVDGEGGHQQAETTDILPYGAGGLHRIVVLNA